MAPLFSKVDLNKLWHDVQNEETLISAKKFGKDLFNISKVIGHKKVVQFFLTHSVYTGWAKKLSHILLSISSPNIDRLSKFFHWRILWKIWNKVVYHHTLTVSLHYLVKYKFSKITIITI